MKVNWKFHKSSDKLLRPPWKVGILSGGEHNLRLKRSVVFHVKQINLTGHKNTYFSRRKKSISKWVSDWKKIIVLGLFGHLATKMKRYNIWYIMAIHLIDAMVCPVNRNSIFFSNPPTGREENVFLKVQKFLSWRPPLPILDSTFAPKVFLQSWLELLGQ